MLKCGACTEDVRLLIQVSAAEEKTIRTFAAQHPLTGRVFLVVIEFRRDVLDSRRREDGAALRFLRYLGLRR